MNDVSREIDQLLKERERYVSWLERLELEKAGATEQAYTRVRRDYRERLDGVTHKLRSHREAIDVKLRGLAAQISELEGERAERAEQLDEARLRHLVGEYRDDAEWREMEGGLVTGLNDAERRLEEVRGEVRGLQEIVSLVDVGEGAPPAQPRPEPVHVESPVTATAPPEVIEVQAEAAPPAAERPSQPARDVEVEARREEAPATPPREAPATPPREAPAVARAREPSPSPPAAPSPPSPSPSPASTPAVPEPAETDSKEDEEYFSLEALVLEDEDMEDVFISTEPQAEEGSQPERPVEVQEAGAGAEQGESAVGDELAFLESLSLGGNEESEFSFLEQRGSGTPQTIICPHCSAANDPAEWYCTECGEELPAE